MISKSKDQKQMLWSRVDKFNRPKGTIDGKQIGREQAYVQKWRLSQKDNLKGINWWLRAFALMLNQKDQDDGA